MLEEKVDLSESVYGGENSVKNQVSEETKINPDGKTGFLEKGSDYLGESDHGQNGSESKPSKNGLSGHQELTLSYMCDNSKLGLNDNGKSLVNSFENVKYKGKLVVCEGEGQGECRWVERDFMHLNEMGENSAKRAVEEDEIDREVRDKKPKIETLNLSLALPDVSLSLAASNKIQNGDPSVSLRPSRSTQSQSQSLAPSNSNTLNTYSNDFTGASISYSYSHQFSHNPSCSLTRNSTENYEYSMGSHRRDEQIWNAGEGTNGSVHSRFRPVGDGVSLSNHGSGAFSLMQGNRLTTNSDNLSFFPSELPARPRIDTQSGDSRGREVMDGGRGQRLSRPERILREIVSESIPIMAQIIQELPEEAIESAKDYLKNLITLPEKRDELVGLQLRLERRSDLTREMLSKANQNQLKILVAIRMSLDSFLSPRNHLPAGELVEIFLFEKCKNLNCKRPLPVEDCDCKICSANKGFCSECNCPVCFNFDCANNTCSWVGCDVCSHWCHASCGIQRNLIKPGPSLKGPPGTTEMQFHCLCCGHPSEMFGFTKEVFISCAKQWDLEAMIKELDCVQKIFRGSEDFKGKQVHAKANEMLSKLENKVMSLSEVCNFILQFFNYADGISDFPSSSVPPKDLASIQPTLRKDATPLPPSMTLPPKSSFYNTGSSSGIRDMLPHDLHQIDLKPREDLKIIEDGWSVKPTKKDGFDSVESLVRAKEAEAHLYQKRADDARRESEGYRRMARIQSEKLEEEYSDKLSKLCLQETEERKRKKLEELKKSENAHCDYYKMKIRMQAEIAGLLERMETTKKQWVV